MGWKTKANWLQGRGYPLVIEALAPEGDHRWRASIAGEGTRYGNTIEKVISQVYDWVQESLKK